MEIMNNLEKRGIRPFSDKFKSEALIFILKFHDLKTEELTDKSLAELVKKIEDLWKNLRLRLREVRSKYDYFRKKYGESFLDVEFSWNIELKFGEKIDSKSKVQKSPNSLEKSGSLQNLENRVEKGPEIFEEQFFHKTQNSVNEISENQNDSNIEKEQLPNIDKNYLSYLVKDGEKSSEFQSNSEIGLGNFTEISNENFLQFKDIKNVLDTLQSSEFQSIELENFTEFSNLQYEDMESVLENSSEIQINPESEAEKGSELWKFGPKTQFDMQNYEFDSENDPSKGLSNRLENNMTNLKFEKISNWKKCKFCKEKFSYELHVRPCGLYSKFVEKTSNGFQCLFCFPKIIHSFAARSGVNFHIKTKHSNHEDFKTNKKNVESIIGMAI